MLRSIVCVFSIVLGWSNAADICFTPQRKQSECIPLYDCAPLRSAIAQVPLPDLVRHHLRQSFCGTDPLRPKVCCGPLPNFHIIAAPTTTTPRPPIEKIYDVQSDPANKEDSHPAPRGSCGPDSSGNKIVGGTETELDEFPWLAMLGYLNEVNEISIIKYSCGGSLINQRYVLTAAHCLRVSLVTVRLGEHDTRTSEDCYEGECADPVQEIPVQAFYIYPTYNEKSKDSYDDIGLVRLSQRATYNYFVQPICLVSPENSTYVPGETTYVAGWGRIETNGSYSPVKLKVDVKIQESNSCRQKFFGRFNVRLSEKQLCAGGEKDKDSCQGDSGGPLMRATEGDVWEAIGVVSFGAGCGLRGWPAVYTHVAAYLDWIQAKLLETNI